MRFVDNPSIYIMIDFSKINIYNEPEKVRKKLISYQIVNIEGIYKFRLIIYFRKEEYSASER